MSVKWMRSMLCFMPSIFRLIVFKFILMGYSCNRYLLRRSALELFLVDRSNFFFDFGVSLLQYILLFLSIPTCCHFDDFITFLILLLTNAYCWWLLLLNNFYFSRVRKDEEMHIERLFKHGLPIWIIYILQLRFSPCFFLSDV